MIFWSHPRVRGRLTVCYIRAVFELDYDQVQYHLQTPFLQPCSPAVARSLQPSASHARNQDDSNVCDDCDTYDVDVDIGMIRC